MLYLTNEQKQLLSVMISKHDFSGAPDDGYFDKGNAFLLDVTQLINTANDNFSKIRRSPTNELPFKVNEKKDNYDCRELTKLVLDISNEIEKFQKRVKLYIQLNSLHLKVTEYLDKRTTDTYLKSSGKLSPMSSKSLKELANLYPKNASLDPSLISPKDELNRFKEKLLRTKVFFDNNSNGHSQNLTENAAFNLYKKGNALLNCLKLHLKEEVLVDFKNALLKLKPLPTRNDNSLTPRRFNLFYKAVETSFEKIEVALNELSSGSEEENDPIIVSRIKK